MVNAKPKDFIEVSYVGRIKDSNKIFDLTDADLAKKEKIFSETADYSPKVICLGEGHILKSIDEELIGKEVGKYYSLELPPEKAFGKKDPSLVKVVQTSVLHQQKINPFPGLQINASGLLGTIRAVNSGRTTIDFNHPLAGRNVIYEIKINRIVNDNSEKVSGMLKNIIGLKKSDFEVLSLDNKVSIKTKIEIPKEMKSSFIAVVNKLISDTIVSFD